MKHSDAAAKETANTETGSEEIGPPQMVPPTVGGSLLMVVMMLFVQGVVAFGLGLFYSFFFGGHEENSHPIAWIVLVSDLVILFLLNSALRTTGAASPPAVGVRWPQIPVKECVVTGVILFLAILALDELYVWYLGEDIQKDIRQIFQVLVDGGDFASMSAWIFAVVIGAPIIEEFIFRGYLQTALTNKLGPIAGLVGASLIFAGIHFDLQAFPVLFTAGLGFGYLYYRTGSLLPSMLLHFAMNSWATIYLLVFEIT